jgi:hypothetical protein
VVAAIVFAPHFAWLVENNFITVTYAGERSGDPRPFARIWNPTEFLLGQAYHVLPMLVILYPALGRTDESRSGDRFLHAVVLGPLVLLLLLSVTTGCLLREIWGSPLWTFLGIWMLTTFGGSCDGMNLRRVLLRAGVTAAMMMVLAYARVELRPYIEGLPHRTQFPGKELTEEVQRRWAANFDEPYPIVAGEAWAAGNVCCFSPHRPVLYSSGHMGYLVFESRATPWTNDDDLNTRGGVVLWDALQLGDAPPESLQQRLPRLLAQPPVVLPYHSIGPVPPIRVGVGFVPPCGK